MALLPVLKNLALNARSLYDLVNYEYTDDERTLREEMRLKRNAWKAILPEHPFANWTDSYIQGAAVTEMIRKLKGCHNIDAYETIFPVVVRSFVLLLEDRSVPGTAAKYPIFNEYLDLLNGLVGKSKYGESPGRDTRHLEEAKRMWGRMKALLEGMSAFERRKVSQNIFKIVCKCYLAMKEEMGLGNIVVEGLLKHVGFWQREVRAVGGEIIGTHEYMFLSLSNRELEEVNGDLDDLQVHQVDAAQTADRESRRSTTGVGLRQIERERQLEAELEELRGMVRGTGWRM
jgi:hypothetical protein